MKAFDVNDIQNRLREELAPYGVSVSFERWNDSRWLVCGVLGDTPYYYGSSPPDAKGLVMWMFDEEMRANGEAAIQEAVKNFLDFFRRKGWIENESASSN